MVSSDEWSAPEILLDWLHVQEIKEQRQGLNKFINSQKERCL
jgi:hypothetical protein